MHNILSTKGGYKRTILKFDAAADPQGSVGSHVTLYLNISVKLWHSPKGLSFRLAFTLKVVDSL